MSKKRHKTYEVSAPASSKDKMKIHLGKSKVRTQMPYGIAVQYSFYSRATRKAERKLKQELRDYTR